VEAAQNNPSLRERVESAGKNLDEKEKLMEFIRVISLN